jgi:hypothetical protein
MVMYKNNGEVLDILEERILLHRWCAPLIYLGDKKCQQ